MTSTESTKKYSMEYSPKTICHPNFITVTHPLLNIEDFSESNDCIIIYSPATEKEHPVELSPIALPTVQLW